MIAITINLGNAGRLLDEPGARAHMLRTMAGALGKQNQLTMGLAIRDRMSFSREAPTTSEGLRTVSGQLRKAMRSTTPTVNGDSIYSTIGSNLRYYAVHEFGWSGTQSVREHVRKMADQVTPSGMNKPVSMAVAKAAGLLTKAGKVRKGAGTVVEGKTHLVKAHQRKANYPARQMVGRTIEARMKDYAAALTKAAKESLQGGKE
jgi:phage gpG-like protein